MDDAIESAVMDKYPFAKFSIPFVAVGVMHCRQKYLNDVVVRSIFYSKSLKIFLLPYLINFWAPIAGLRI